MKKAVFLLFMMTAAASAQWSQTIDTLTTGNSEDINPQVDRAGLALPYSGIYGSTSPGEWIVFERWSGNSDAISAVKFSGSSLKWDSTVSTISPAESGAAKKYPDVCTAKNGVSVAAWQQESNGIWNIYCSSCSIDSGNWSAPSALTSDSVSNTNARVMAVSDSDFVIVWKRKSAILFTLYGPGETLEIDTLYNSNTDSTEFDLAGNSLVWTEKSDSGNTICIVGTIAGFSPPTISSSDTLVCEGDVSNPRFMMDGGGPARTFAFNLNDSGRYSAWWSGYPFSAGYSPVKLAGDTSADYLNAVYYRPAYVTAAAGGTGMRVSSLPLDFWVWQRQTASDTSLLFNDAGVDTVLPGRNPSISPQDFFIDFRISQGFVVWQSDVSGRSHIYSRSFLWTQTGIDEPAGPPTSFVLDQNFPNPFNPTTAIGYRLPAASHVVMTIYDVLGRKVATLVDGTQSAGEHSVEFNGSKFASGVYFYRLTAPGTNITRKMMLIK